MRRFALIGLLVMTSAGTAMEEICGQAALYFDPHDVRSVRSLHWRLRSPSSC